LPIPAKILVVDDQPYVRQTLRSLLARQAGWEIYEAGDGKAAVKCAQEMDFDVVVMDIFMPGMNGIETAHELHHIAPGTRVMLISSHCHPPSQGIAIARLLGDCSFLEKKAAAKELVPAVIRMLSPVSQAV
jgi:DNA-binding NarL/FixJ family response regulator